MTLEKMSQNQERLGSPRGATPTSPRFQHDELEVNEQHRYGHVSDDEDINNRESLDRQIEMRELNTREHEDNTSQSQSRNSQEVVYYDPSALLERGTYLNTADERAQPNNKRKVSNSIVACCISCCCCLPIGMVILLVVYLVGLFLLAPQMTANLLATVSESKNSGISSSSSSFVNIRKGVIAQNGLKYILLKNSFKKNRFTALMHVNTGSVNEEENEQGISHMVEHMAFDNSKEFEGRAGVWNQIEKSNVGYFNGMCWNSL